MNLGELYRLLRGCHVQAVGIVNTLWDSTLFLDSDLTVLSANSAFYRTFEASPDDTIGVPVQRLGNGAEHEKRILLLPIVDATSAVRLTTTRHFHR